MKMNKLSRFILLLVFPVLTVPSLFSQEMVVPLSGNPLAEKYHRQHPALKSAAAESSLELPVIDDFSSTLVIPDQAIWIDRHVYINRSYGVNPVTVGVATLDAIDGDGSVYPGATIEPETYIADRLTSQAVNLALDPSDSVYLSFFYQPMGYGEQPDPSDSLCVDFYDPATEMWSNVWHIPGDTLKEFTLVMLPVTDPRYLVDGFRFRFRNLASLPYNSDYFDLRGNVDHWNIDYVLLDKGRTVKDPALHDVAVTEPLSSLLKVSQSIPWTHFESAYINAVSPNITMVYRNNDDITRNVTRYYTIRDMLADKTYSSGSPTSKDIPAGDTMHHKFSSYFQFDFGEQDSGMFELKAWIRTDTFDYKQNDTIVRIQKFSDYYAFDDGSAEAGYGIRGQNTNNGKVAVKFNSYISDYIGGVDICFNKLLDSVNLGYYFRLEVWSDDNGKPGPALYIDENDYTPSYTDDINGFVRYYFAEPVAVNKDFYVGWMQYNKFLLNVGLDRNNAPSSSRTYFNFTGEWQQSLIPGNLMIRPFLYRNPTGSTHPAESPGELRIYPNPSSGLIRLDLPEDAGTNLEMEIYDLSGRKILSGMQQGREIDTGNLGEGLYLLRVRGENKQVYTSKFLISR
ncbi:MAG: T9SS type A sorting domain-containing protein [Bacteroidota bacterium]